ncbi:MAG: hypothetical protein ACYDBJ_06410 [Aggregatilineales bacterium]
MASRTINPNQLNSFSEDYHLGRLPAYFLVLGGTLLVFTGALQVIISIGFFLGVSIAWIDVPFAVLAAAFATVWAARVYFPGRHWIYPGVIVGVLLIMGVSLVISTAFYDLSVDGRTYHTMALVSLAQGWNPIRDPPLTQGVMSEYVNFYAKGAWLDGAVLYNLTGNLQASKAFNLIGLAITFCVAYPAFSTRLKTGQAMLFALLVALNPVIVTQLLSLYVDGQFVCLLSAAVSLLILIVCQPHRLLLFWLAAIVLMTINVKLTGPLYILILGGGFLLWYALTHRPKRTELALWIAGGAFAGLFLVGYNPYVTQYVTQTIARGDPFYPTTYVDLTRINYTAPFDFKGEDTLTNVFRSLFSRSEGEIEQPVVYKIPFTISQSELIAFYFPDTHVGGFGPFFGGIILLILLALAVSIRHIRLLWPKVATIAIISALLFISVFINPEAWWARYVPQLWLLPILSVFMIAIMARTRLQAALVRLILVAFLLNCIIVLAANVVQQQRASNLIALGLAQLKHSNDLGATIPVKFDVFVADRILFDSVHIHYTVVDQLPCAKEAQRKWIGSNTQYCLPPG